MTRTARTTRGGWTPTGTSASRRESTNAAPGTKAERTRARLLDAARTAFGTHGYIDCTVDHIVEAAGLARGSFYTYFASKTDIFQELAATIDDQVAQGVVDFDRAACGDPIANLRTANRNYLAVVRDNADLYRLSEQIAVHDEDTRAARRRSRQTHVRRVATRIRRWQQRGVADPDVDPEPTAAALVSMLSGFAQWIHVGGDHYDDDVAADTMTDIWVRACGLRTAPTERDR